MFILLCLLGQLPKSLSISGVFDQTSVSPESRQLIIPGKAFLCQHWQCESGMIHDMTKARGGEYEPAAVSHGTARQPHSIPPPAATFAPFLLCICCSIVTAAGTAYPTAISNNFFLNFLFFNSTAFPLSLT